MRILIVTILTFYSITLFAQSDCSSAQFLRKTAIKVDSSLHENWFKVRAKGNVLNFVATLQNGDSVDYEIYPFVDCSNIQHTTPIRSVIKGKKTITDEVWNKFIADGVCICPTCKKRIELKQNGKLNIKQGSFYLIRILGHHKPFTFKMDYTNIDTLNPIQFELDSVIPEEIEVGMVYQLKDIFFIPAKATYLPKSIPELKKLKTFLEKHEVIKIQVRGHVNGPAQTKPEFYQTLSNQRAEAIQKFLLEAGIEKDRIDIKGMSNFQMRYPSPKNPFEAAENRRVEIVITAVN